MQRTSQRLFENVYGDNKVKYQNSHYAASSKTLYIVIDKQPGSFFYIFCHQVETSSGTTLFTIIHKAYFCCFLNHNQSVLILTTCYDTCKALIC